MSIDTFIADDNKTGTLIFSNEIKGEDMLLLVGYVIYFYNAASVDDRRQTCNHVWL